MTLTIDLENLSHTALSVINTSKLDHCIRIDFANSSVMTHVMSVLSDTYHTSKCNLSLCYIEQM